MDLTPSLAVPYCGTAPLPGELWQAWNPDPWVIAALLALLTAGGALRGRVDGRRRALMLGLAVAAMALAFLSPLCALASALFSVRVAHHLLLVSAAAPLLAPTR